VCNDFNDALTYILFIFKSCESCCFMYHFVDVARKFSRFCEMARRSKAVGPRWATHLASFLVMPRQWWPTNPNDIYSVTLPLCDFAPALNAWVRKSFDLLEFNQTNNASMFSSSIKHLLYRYVSPSLAGHSFDVERIKQTVIKYCFQNTSKNKIGNLYL